MEGHSPLFVSARKLESNLSGDPARISVADPGLSRLRLAAAAVAEAGRIGWWSAFYLVRFLLGRGRGRDARLRTAALLRGYLLRMGPLYIKAGQVLGTQSGLLSKQETDEFRSFFSELPPMSDAERP